MRVEDVTSHVGGLRAGVLVGGSSRRMGTCKALLAHPGGGTFLDFIVRVVSDFTSDVVLLGNPPASWNGVSFIPVLRDDVAGAGPLAGLVSLLKPAGPEWRLLVACDLPLLDIGALERLSAAIDGSVDAVAYRTGGGTAFHACAALYHVRVLDAAICELGATRRLQSLLGAVRTRALEPPDVNAARALDNVNTPEEYERFLAAYRGLTR